MRSSGVSSAERHFPSGSGRVPVRRSFRVELFHDVNVDWLGKKWYFLGFSLIFSVAGVLSILFWHGIKLGIDFRGGTLVYVQFEQAPDLDRIRQAIDRAGIHDSLPRAYGTAAQRQVAISLAQKETQESRR